MAGLAARGGACADCDPSTASTASISSDLHKYQAACSCGGAQYAECAGGSVASAALPGATSPGAASPGARKTDRPPALPPRPPPRPRPRPSTAGSTDEPSIPPVPAGPRKYVWWCAGMGAAACLLGGALLAAALLLRSRTASLQHLETIPTPVPATMLVLTGICVMSLARRRNRYSYLIKVAGACCLVCALTCVLVTITTTVIHMNRLQTLRECVFTKETKTCTCYSVLLDSQNTAEDDGVKCVFESVTDCAAVHGALYRCLRAVFGLSVAGVLVCICSAMLAYQLLSHERKKMYWEQLELRCRSLYRPATGRPPTQQPQISDSGLEYNELSGVACSQVCGECCAQCRAAAAASWDIQHRFWASGRVGNLYSPNPGTGRRVSPWSWFPWPRNSNQRVGGSSSGDSAYGFGNSPGGYWQLGPPPPYTPHHRYLHQMVGGLPGHTHEPHRHTCIGAHEPPGRSLAPCVEERVHTAQCHHQESAKENFPVELEEVHQHTCQNHQQHSDVAQTVEIPHQGEENLAFQCEKQSPQRQGRGGESELYFADVSSCCNVSLKAIEYCGGLVGTIEAQADTSSGDSDMGTCPAFKGRQHRVHRGLHGGRPSLDNHCHNSPLTSLNCRNSLHCRESEEEMSNRMGHVRNSMHCHEGEEESLTRSIPEYRCQNPSCSGSRDDITIHESGLNLNIAGLQCHGVQLAACHNIMNGIGEAHIMNLGQGSHCIPGSNRSSLRIRSSPNRASLIGKSSPTINGNSVGLPPISQSPIRRRQNDEELNDSSASSLSHSRRKGIDDSQGSSMNDEGSGNQFRRKGLDESNLADDHGNNISPLRRKEDESILNNEHNISHSPLRRKAVEDSISNNDQSISMSPLRRKAIEESIMNNEQNASLSPLRRLDLEESILENEHLSPLRRKVLEESILSNQQGISPLSRSALEEMLLNNTLEQNMSALRKRDLEDINMLNNHNDLNLSMAQMRRKALEESMISNNDSNVSLSPFRRKAHEESMLNNDHSLLSPFRRKTLEDSIGNNDQNISYSPLRRNNLEETILNNDHNVSLIRRKALDDSISDQNISLAQLRRMGIEESILNNEHCISSRRKDIEESILNNELNASTRRKGIIEETLHNNEQLSLGQLRRLGIEEVILNNRLGGAMHGSHFSTGYSSLSDGMDNSLAGEVEGSRRGVCLAPDLRYGPQGGQAPSIDTDRPVHLRCCSDSNTMDSGWQSGSEKHVTD